MSVKKTKRVQTKQRKVSFKCKDCEMVCRYADGYSRKCDTCGCCMDDGLVCSCGKD